ncbi:unnamed protein product [Hermetia illucens]|uniref:Uncharacterized protein n=2 Tax=Hermetia illucens TaxID=343691 RepID=A0A7R8V124_HERIL|nr:unnamed protein product [Hermetia illucens]
MKHLRNIVFVFFFSIVQSSEKEGLLESDLEINNAHYGIGLHPGLPDVPLNLSDASYFHSELHFNSSDEVLDAEKDDVRHKREQPESEYDYSKAYEQFIAENFRFSENKDESSEPVGEKLCKTLFKAGKRCTVCKNTKTNAQAENCVYSSAPELRKYAFKQERSYGNGSNEQDTYSSSEEKPALPTSYVNHSSQHAHYRTTAVPPLNEELSHEQLTQSTLDPHLSRSATGDTDDDKNNWSKCKRRYKDGTTCYYCKDKNGLRNEECVYRGAETKHNIEVPRRDPKRPRQSSPSVSLDAEFNPMEKEVFKRTVSMRIQRAADEVWKKPRTFLYAKRITHATK